MVNVPAKFSISTFTLHMFLGLLGYKFEEIHLKVKWLENWQKEGNDWTYSV